MKEKIVLVTAGGHISSFHASMIEMCETIEEKAADRFEIFGAWGGLGGLIKGNLKKLYYGDLEENRAGSLFLSDREHLKKDQNKIGAIIDVVKRNNVYAIVMMGGDDHLKDADDLHKSGIRVVGYPKTMDGDLSSLITLGWHTAVTIGANQTRFHYNTAITRKKIFYVGLFGRDTDWVPCAVSVYGGADRCIPCEKKYEWDFIWSKIEDSLKENKENYGVEFAVVNYSEGAKIDKILNPPGKISYDLAGNPKLQPEWTGMELVRLSEDKGKSAVFQAHTYEMRDCPPTETDKKLSRMAGKECMEMILREDFGKSVIFVPDNHFYKTSRGEFEKVAVKRKVTGTGFFDYDKLRTKQDFVSFYGDLFKDSLGKPPEKQYLVYKNMLRQG
ncbi:MAG: 6-phosphofructokinase [Candidatus Nanoarchaeia archaeon]|nr:6-phosphofructokinase [Candidatus Nanoarchaeia archaeon]MDD5741526.1 6-phosphofructokinase [Candidatus Nanoarchaeia archaeon]